MSRHFAVFGHPVAHSLSPRIHAAFGKQAGIDIDYVAIDAQAEDFAAALAAFEVDNAIYLVGSASSYGWYIPKEEEIVEFGINVHRRSYRNESYIRWRKAE